MKRDNVSKVIEQTEAYEESPTGYGLQTNMEEKNELQNIENLEKPPSSCGGL